MNSVFSLVLFLSCLTCSHGAEITNMLTIVQRDDNSVYFHGSLFDMKSSNKNINQNVCRTGWPLIDLSARNPACDNTGGCRAIYFWPNWFPSNVTSCVSSQVSDLLAPSEVMSTQYAELYCVFTKSQFSCLLIESDTPWYFIEVNFNAVGGVITAYNGTRSLPLPQVIYPQPPFFNYPPYWNPGDMWLVRDRYLCKINLRTTTWMSFPYRSANTVQKATCYDCSFCKEKSPSNE